MDNVQILLINGATGVSTISEKLISFRFIKERYTPYTSLFAEFLADGDLSKISEIKLIVNGNLVHHGNIDSLSINESNGMKSVAIKSLGFSIATLQNQFAPGVLNNMTLQQILRSKINLTKVLYENLSQVVNYIFVDENSSIWDAVVAFSLKGFSKYPYISGTNTVTVNGLGGSAKIIDAKNKIISSREITDISKIISDIYMADHLGQYGTYHRSLPFAAQNNIIRHKYIRYDEQWNSDPQMALKSRLDYSARAMKSTEVKLLGVHYADITHKITFINSNLQITNKELSGIEIQLDSGTITTKLSFYSDMYCNI